MSTEREALLYEFLEHMMICLPVRRREWSEGGQHTIWLQRDEIDRLHEWADQHGLRPLGGINPRDRERIAGDAAVRKSERTPHA